MCNSHDCKHDSNGLTRRIFGAAALAGLAASAVPLAARAADPDDVPKDLVLALTCIDYRLVNDAVTFFNKLPPGSGKYDLVVLAGASLAAASEGMFLPTVAGFWQQFGAAYALHKIKKLVVLDHMGCGAFNVQFNGGNKLDPVRERALHIEVMTHLKAILPMRAEGQGVPRNIPVEFYLASNPERLPVTIEPIHIP
jgi:hypothetical protein